MSPRFLKMIPFLWKWEGTSYENDSDDPGGETKFGVDKRSHPKENIRNLTENRAKAIYWEEYWEKYGCEKYPFPLGECVFNCAVNAGYSRAQKIFASGATNAAAFLDGQDAFYMRLANYRPRSQKYLKGWLNRTSDLRKFLGI